MRVVLAVLLKLVGLAASIVGGSVGDDGLMLLGVAGFIVGTVLDGVSVELSTPPLRDLRAVDEAER